MQAHTDDAGGSAGAWSRQRLVLVLAALAVAAVGLLAGLGYALWAALGSAGATGSNDSSDGTSQDPGGDAIAGDEIGDGVDVDPAATAEQGLGLEVTGGTTRDDVAAAPMLQVRPEDARSGSPAPTPAPTITVPASSGTEGDTEGGAQSGVAGAADGGGAVEGDGAVEVPSGFPRTPEGAVAQLAAVSTVVLQEMSIPVVNDVHEEWTARGAVPVEDWQLTRNVQAFLGTAGMGQTKDITTAVVADPVAAQVKGYDEGPDTADGVDWVLACVLFDVRASIRTDARMGWGHCEPMIWQPDANADQDQDQGGRWVIGPGPAAAAAPSTWPGTELSITAGWRTWVEAGP